MNRCVCVCFRMLAIEERRGDDSNLQFLEVVLFQQLKERKRVKYFSGSFSSIRRCLRHHRRNRRHHRHNLRLKIKKK